MKFNLNTYMAENRIGKDKFALVKKIECADGFSVSAQANEINYCSPRESFLTDYSLVELGYPSDYMGDEFVEYCEDKENTTNTVYSYVPVELVEALIDSHGVLL